MQSINWQQFGLKKNPYDTLPLIEGADLPIEKAFVGREKEIDFLKGMFGSEDRVCLTVCGDVGVGKTSLVNFHKFIWKYTTVETKLLFSFRREIEAHPDLLNKKNFLLEIIGSVLREINLLDPDLLKTSDLLKKLNQLIDVTQTLSLSFGASAYGFGLDIGGDRTPVPPIQLTVATVENYFVSLLEFIKSNPIKDHHYSGLIVHVNNFDILLSDKSGADKVNKFFNEIRDILQTPNVYFVFIGPRNFYKDIIAREQRVRSIFFSTPLLLNPLSKTEIIQAFDERMNILKSQDVVEYIKPVEDDVIYRLYDLYEGDIRSIMAALRDILGQYSDKLAKTISVDEAMLLLASERWDRIERMSKLTAEQKEVLTYLIRTGKDISQKEAATLFNKAQSNISGYYFRALKDAGIIEEKTEVKRVKYWGLTNDYLPLKHLIEAQSKVKKAIEKDMGQPQLF